MTAERIEIDFRESSTSGKTSDGKETEKTGPFRFRFFDFLSGSVGRRSFFEQSDTRDDSFFSDAEREHFRRTGNLFLAALDDYAPTPEEDYEFRPSISGGESIPLEHYYHPVDEARTCSHREAARWCRDLARSHYENFSVVTFFLPRALHTPFYVVYAFCRCADDLADEILSAERSLRLLDWWNAELHQAWKRSRLARPATFKKGPPSGRPGRSVHPVFVALEELFRRFPRLSVEPFSNLLVAFRRDQTKHSYETYDEILDYCRYSANPVGRIILTLMKPEATETDFRWSDSICTGLQLANFWQDVRRDTLMGRNYIPEDVVDRYSSFLGMMRDLCDDAACRLKAGRPLVRSVPRRFRFDLKLFIEGGLAILEEIERVHYQVDEVRPTLSKWRKFLIAFRAALWR